PASLSCCFFFSSRRRHTRSLRDWSSDVCSSDLKAPDDPARRLHEELVLGDPVRGEDVLRRRDPGPRATGTGHVDVALRAGRALRSEERRVGKECRSRGSPYHTKTEYRAITLEDH